jgi:dTDP-D-glucose 4,6-dehydratase
MLTLYGDRMQIRDWLFVKDHCGAIRRVFEAGKLGETFEIGIRKTVHLYLDHPDWVAHMQSGSCRDWVSQHYCIIESQSATEADS